MEEQDKLIAIELNIQQWNLVLNSLAQRPFAEVSGLIQEIQSQASKSLETTEEISE